MVIISVFALLVFLYSLVSRRLEQTVVTAPIVFTAAGILLVFTSPGLTEIDLERENLLKLAELGLVMLLFTDATHIKLNKLKSHEKLPVRLLSIGMLPTILMGAAADRLSLNGHFLTFEGRSYRKVNDNYLSKQMTARNFLLNQRFLSALSRDIQRITAPSTVIKGRRSYPNRLPFNYRLQAGQIQEHYNL